MARLVTSLFTSLFICVISHTSLAQAEEGDALFAMSFEELLAQDVTVAARKSESWLASSGTVYVVSRSDIERYGWRDLKEILASVPNMDYFYQWSWLPGGQRGFTGNMSGTLMLIDGREVQNLLANEAFIMNNFPSARIERVEILQGPNSTLYGGNATQGVINVITRLDTGVNEVTVLGGEVGTHHGHGLFHYQQGEVELAVSASYFASDQDYREIREFLVDDQAFSRNSKDALRNHNPDDFRNREKNVTLDSRLSTPWFYLGNNLTRTTNVSGIEAVAFDYITGDDAYRGYSSYYLGKDMQPSANWSGNIELSYFREYKEKYRLSVDNPEQATRYEDLALYTEREDIGPSDRIRLNTQWHYQAGSDQDWILGYDGWRTEIGRKVKYRQTAEGVKLVTPDSWPTDKERSDKHAVFGQYSKLWRFGERTLKVNAGLRYHRQDYTNASWLPRVSMVYQPSADQAFKLTYGKAFRPPTIFEFDLVVDDEIESQTMQMYEFNWSSKFRWRGVEFANISALYSMQAKNFYQKVQDPNTQIWRTVVAGEHRVSGWENQLRWHAQRWHGQLALRYISPDKTQVAGRSVVLDVPRYKVKLGLGYTLGKHWQIAAFVDHWDETLTEANRFEQSGTEVVTIPAWTTFNANLTYTRGNSTLGVYIENLFDKTYYHGNARGVSPVKYIQAPRNLRLSWSYRF
ncbi:TonB-dependent receptor plug domain-containing protein [Pseudoalteromonas rubra]|uniref:TonB-dependent receptor plug domain-containing protein n=1 Tax=Pseudoalteromonas rubra TaxID=43658 RepID=UPI0013DDE043|nr:TonB-dependent receptor [Pseudoalteromonas rubra]